MNYLSHFAVDQLPGNHAFNTGLILPDVTKKWIRNLSPPAGIRIPDNCEQFYLGCQHHYNADKKFHTSSFFTHLSHQANEYMKAASLSEQLTRKWFIAHIAVEVLLDRSIVRDEPWIVDAFYDSLDAVNDEDLAAFLRFNGMADPSAFFVPFDHFRKVQYIRYYPDNNKLMYSLTRIMLRAGLKEPSQTDQEKLLNALLIFEQNELGGKQPVSRLLKNIFE